MHLVGHLSALGLSDAAWLVSGVSLLLAASVIIYRLTLHPLSRFPGPKLAAATKWYEFYYDIIKAPGGQFAKEMERMHDIYGPIIRINPDEIHVRDPLWLDTLYAPNPTQRDKYPPAASMVGLPLGSHGTIDHDVHRKRRVANAKLLSKRAILSDGQVLMRQHVQALEGLFAKALADDVPVDLHTVMLAFTTDTLYDYAFGRGSGYMQDPDASRGWRRAMASVAAVTPFVKQFPWIVRVVMRLPTLLLASVLPDLTRLLAVHGVMGSLVADYLTRQDRPQLDKQGQASVKTATQRPRTLFHAIEGSALPFHEKTASRLQQEGATMLFAGSETTARLLVHTMFHLLDNPDILRRVKHEIISAMTDGTVPDLRILEKLPLLTASVRESLRLRAATTSRLPLVSRTALRYGDWVIPAGTPVSMSHPDILLDPTIYPEPLTFDPERWFHATERANHAFCAFGKGTRMCQGMDFAYAEMYIALAVLLTRFELQLYDTHRGRDIDHARDCFLGEPDPASPGVRVRVVADGRAD